MRRMYVLFIVPVAFCLMCVANLHAADCVYVQEDVDKVNNQGYIMSWLFLDPFIEDNIGSDQSAGKDYFDDQGGEANLKPKEGDEVEIAETNSEHVWTRVNFLDLVAMGELTAAVGGNELDIACWGPRDSVNYKQEYLVAYLKWNSDTKAKFTVGVDDATEVFFNGELIVEHPSASQDWGAGNAGSKEVSVKGGEWNVLVVGCYEAAGEWGITVQVDPVPNIINNVGPPELFAVEPMDKLTTTWGKIRE